MELLHVHNTNHGTANPKVATKYLYVFPSLKLSLRATMNKEPDGGL
jgi:hypothetical protein